MPNLFCFQCEQTAGGKACQGQAGVCGKSESAAAAQDRLTGELIGLARALDGPAPTADTYGLIMDGLLATLTNVNFDPRAIGELTERVVREKDNLVPRCGDCAPACGRNDYYDLGRLWSADEDIRSLKSLVLFGLRGLAAYAAQARLLGASDDGVNEFLPRALRAVGDENYGREELLALALETGQVNLKCMELLDRANRGAFGRPRPATVALGVEKGPFIIVSGHELRDLKLLLEQTAGRGVNIYTHGEMLPAHAYPELNKHAHLKGHFGTAWQNQTREFDGLPGPILFTTNCLMPVRDSYGDRVFTTSVVGYPGVKHIGEDKNFQPLIDQALALGGFAEDRPSTGINGGSAVTTGFGHEAVLAAAETIVGAVKSGAIRHFFLVGGCDGAKPGRNYYTELVRQTPPDTVVLTLACGKFRFNDLNLGEIGGLPRLLDMGQCNDAYSAIKVALALAEAFGCGVNELPLTLVLSWYEQKAVSILLTLLHLGLKNIRLGPSLPAFVSPGVLQYLVENFKIAPITTPEADLAAILG
ncbi:MAG: hydroxylamine reductase [Candidatus Adiutrix sp.]|jgi:hydroxylamine reductase|nr:hydroxylamine reductase [Candidatus Adiutrix sp.]